MTALCYFTVLSKPQLNHNSTRRNITLSWVRHENDLANHPTPPPTQRNFMVAISHLLLTQFWWNFKCRFLETSRTDSNCHGEICPCDICPYQEYLSSNWPGFYETLKISSWEHLEQIRTVRVTFVQATFVLVTFVHIRNISAVTDPILTKFFVPNFLVALNFFWQNFFGAKFVWPTFCLIQYLFNLDFFGF